MRMLEAPVSIPDEMDFGPNVTTRVTISIDPLVLDEFKRELTTIPIIRIMEQQQFHSRAQADRFMEGLILGGLTGAKTHSSPAQKAEDDARILAHDAFEAKTITAKKKLAIKSIETWAGCAEAYITLARMEELSDKKIELLQTAMENAKKQIKGTKFLKPEGYFWQYLETRAYMRARTALAFAQWEGGSRPAAIDHLKALLELNPADNQGLRYHLLNWLLEYDASAPDVDKYCSKYEEETSAFGKYACVLWRYSRYGDCKLTLNALKAAVAANKFVPTILCGAVKAPDFEITRVVRGSELEAIAYQHLYGSVFKKIDGALQWLSNNCSTLVTSKTILRKIEAAEPLETDGVWMAREPVELTNLF